jgi:hypothetical protein
MLMPGRTLAVARLSCLPPDQHFPVLVDGDLVAVDEFVREIVQGRIIQIKLALEHAV